MGWPVVSSCRQMACGHVSEFDDVIGDNDWPLVASVQQIVTVGFFSCSLSWWFKIVSWGLTTSELRVGVETHPLSSLDRSPLATRIPLQKKDWTRSCKNQPW